MRPNINFAPAEIARGRILHPLGRICVMIGDYLQRAIATLVLGGLFFGCFTPVAWILRARGKDLLSLHRRTELKSYWIDRSAAGQDPRTMRNQS
jgi:hypothetical protein